MGPGGVLFDLFPEQIVVLELFEARMVFLEQVGVLWKFILRQEHFDEALIGMRLFLDDSVPL